MLLLALLAEMSHLLGNKQGVCGHRGSPGEPGAAGDGGTVAIALGCPCRKKTRGFQVF